MNFERFIIEITNEIDTSNVNLKAARSLLSDAPEFCNDTSSLTYKRVRFALLNPGANNDYELYEFLKYKKEYAQFLLEFLKINEDSLYGKLKVAVIKGQVKKIKTLLKNISISEIENPDPDDESLAIYAFGRWNKDVRKEILQILIDKNLDTCSVRDERGWNLLHNFLWYFGMEGDADLLEITKILVYSGVSPNDPEEQSGRTPLNFAISLVLKDVAHFLIGLEGINLNAKTKSGDTPLHDAVVRSGDLVRMLMDKKDQLDLNAENNVGYTPFHVAKYIRADDEIVANYLLENGADGEELELSPPLKETLKKVRVTAVFKLYIDNLQILNLTKLNNVFKKFF